MLNYKSAATHMSISLADDHGIPHLCDRNTNCRIDKPVQLFVAKARPASLIVLIVTSDSEPGLDCSWAGSISLDYLWSFASIFHEVTNLPYCGHIASLVLEIGDHS